MTDDGTLLDREVHKSILTPVVKAKLSNASEREPRKFYEGGV